jgi:hypothetical protein
MGLADRHGISKEFPPHVLAFMSAAYAATAGDVHLQTDDHPSPGQPAVWDTKTPYRIRASACGRSENCNR